jgi:hypothetical protein
MNSRNQIETCHRCERRRRRDLHIVVAAISGFLLLGAPHAAWAQDRTDDQLPTEKAPTPSVPKQQPKPPGDHPPAAKSDLPHSRDKDQRSRGGLGDFLRGTIGATTPLLSVKPPAVTPPPTVPKEEHKTETDCGDDEEDCGGAPGTFPPHVTQVDDNKDKGTAKAAPTSKIAEGTPPTPVAGDPKDGIDVTGGKVHRGTATIDLGGGDVRVAIECWVQADENAACADFQWYQWDCTAVTSIDWNDGKGQNKDPKIPKPDVSVETRTGSYMKFNQWSPDDYSSTRGKKRHSMFTGQKTPCAEPKEKLTGGAYGGAQNIPIPGQPELKPDQKREHLQRLIDAPDATYAVQPLFLKGFEAGKSRRSDEQPNDEKPITLEITMYFRVALYCADNCLGTFEWHEVQTFTVTPTWKLHPDKGEQTFTGPSGTKEKPVLRYDLTFEVKKVGRPMPVIDAWKAPPC